MQIKRQKGDIKERQSKKLNPKNHSRKESNQSANGQQDKKCKC